MEKKYRTKGQPDRKPVGQLAYEKHWSVEGLVDSLKLKKEDIIAWAKLNKQS